MVSTPYKLYTGLPVRQIQSGWVLRLCGRNLTDVRPKLLIDPTEPPRFCDGGGGVSSYPTLTYIALHYPVLTCITLHYPARPYTPLHCPT